MKISSGLNLHKMRIFIKMGCCISSFSRSHLSIDDRLRKYEIKGFEMKTHKKARKKLKFKKHKGDEPKIRSFSK